MIDPVFLTNMELNNTSIDHAVSSKRGNIIIGSSNYIATKVWHENEANTKDKIISGRF